MHTYLPTYLPTYIHTYIRAHIFLNVTRPHVAEEKQKKLLAEINNGRLAAAS